MPRKLFPKKQFDPRELMPQPGTEAYVLKQAAMEHNIGIAREQAVIRNMSWERFWRYCNVSGYADCKTCRHISPGMNCRLFGGISPMHARAGACGITGRHHVERNADYAVTVTDIPVKNAVLEVLFGTGEVILHMADTVLAPLLWAWSHIKQLLTKKR